MATNIGRGRTNVADIKWAGLDKVLRNLGKQVGVIQGKTRKGLTIVTLKIRRDAQKLTPIDTGNLRASAYTIVGGGKFTRAKANPKVAGITLKERGTSRFKTDTRSGVKVAVEHQAVIDSKKKIQRDPYGIIGFTAHYALPVHEGLKAAGRRVRAGRTKRGGKVVTIKDAQIGQAKFLEEALIKNNKFIITTLRETAV